MKLTHLQIIMLALSCLFVGESQTMPNPATATIETAINTTKTEIKAADNATTKRITATTNEATASETTTDIVCPPNSEYSCKKACLGSCEDLNNPDFACNDTCRCACNDGFVFESVSSHVCVPLKKCDCGALAHFDSCAPEQPSCDNIINQPTTGCKPMCLCNSDYAFSVYKPRVCVPKGECFNVAD